MRGSLLLGLFHLEVVLFLELFENSIDIERLGENELADGGTANRNGFENNGFAIGHDTGNVLHMGIHCDIHTDNGALEDHIIFEFYSFWIWLVGWLRDGEVGGVVNDEDEVVGQLDTVGCYGGLDKLYVGPKSGK